MLLHCFPNAAGQLWHCNPKPNPWITPHRPCFTLNCTSVILRSFVNPFVLPSYPILQHQEVNSVYREKAEGSQDSALLAGSATSPWLSNPWTVPVCYILSAQPRQCLRQMMKPGLLSLTPTVCWCSQIMEDLENPRLVLVGRALKAHLVPPRVIG